MNTRLTVDKAGRVAIPKPLREELQREPDDSLEMESSGEQITLRPGARGLVRLGFLADCVDHSASRIIVLDS